MGGIRGAVRRDGNGHRKHGCGKRTSLPLGLGFERHVHHPGKDDDGEGGAEELEEVVTVRTSL